MDKWFEADWEFSRMLSGVQRPDLARIALEIARDFDPQIDLEHYLEWIANLAQRIRERCPAGAEPIKLVHQINWAMFVEEGFRGNLENYYDPSNSYLNCVIDRKTGIPISLCILYRAVAERLGLALAGLNLPAHFMLKFDGPNGLRFIDPFHGDIVDRERCERRLSEFLGTTYRLREDQLDDCPAALVVARLLRNLKSIHLREGDRMSVLPLQRRLAKILVDDPKELRDLGLLSLQLGRLDDAVRSFEEYLEKWSHESDASLIRSLHRDACRERILRN